MSATPYPRIHPDALTTIHDAPYFSLADFRAGFFKLDARVWPGVVSFIMACGLFIVVLSYNLSRMSVANAELVYWLGLFSMYVPVFLRILLGQPTKREAIMLIVLLGVLLYLTKVTYSPTVLRFVDEQQQWRSAYNAYTANGLFEYNPILLISPSYPGLQNSVIAIASTSSLPLDTAGMVLIGGVRVMLMLGLWVFLEEVTGDEQLTGLACVIYMTNPGYLTFSSYLVYQSLALPMVVLAITALVRWTSARSVYRLGLMFVVIAGIMVVIITHHVTSYLMVIYFAMYGTAFFLLKLIQGTFVERFLRWIGRFVFGWKRDTSLEIEDNTYWDIYTWLTVLTLIAIVIWVVYIAYLTVNYLGPQFGGIYDEFTTFLTSEREKGEYKAPALPRSELLLGLSAIAVIVFGVLFGVWRALTRYKLQRNMVGLIVVAGGFYLFLVLRFVSTRGGELLSRTWAFTFIALSVFLALSMLTFFNFPYKWLRWVFRPVLTVVFCIYIAGNIASGWPPYWARLPGPYVPGAFDRSADLVALETTWWVKEHIEPNSVFLADFVMLHLLGGYAGQAPYLGAEDVFISETLTDFHRGLMRDASVDYIAVDLRIADAISPVGFYYVSWELGKYPSERPLDIEYLYKFEEVYDFDRLYDNGPIIVYDVQEYSDLQPSP